MSPLFSKDLGAICIIASIFSHKYLADNSKKQAEQETMTRLVSYPTIIRIMTVLDISSLTVPQLLEYGLTRKDINDIIVSGIIEIDKLTLLQRPKSGKLRVMQYLMYLDSKKRFTTPSELVIQKIIHTKKSACTAVSPLQ